MVETHEPSAKACAHLGEILRRWSDVHREDEWNVVLIDSSAGSGKERGYHRHECLDLAESHLAPGAYVIIHDWRRRGGMRTRRVLESDSRYRLYASYDRGNGWGIYEMRHAR